MEFVKSIKKHLWIYVYIGAFAFVIYYVFEYYSEVKEIFSIHFLPFLLLSLFFNFLSFLSGAMAWAYMVKRQYKNTSFIKMIWVYYASQITRYIPGNVWSFIARFKNAGKYGVRKSSTALFLAVENINLILVPALLSLLSLSIVEREYDFLLYIVGIILTVLLFVFIFRPELLSFPIEKFAVKFKTHISIKELKKGEIAVVFLLYISYWMFFGLALLVRLEDLHP